MKRIELRDFGPRDFDRLISWIEDEKSLIQFAGTALKFPLTHQQLKKYIADEDRRVFKIVHRESGQVIGHAELSREGSGMPRLCRLLLGEKKYRGKGYGQELVKGLTEICFRLPETEAVDLNVYHWNLPAQRCYEKVGFRKNFIPGNNIKVDGEEWISVNMKITRKEWEDSQAFFSDRY